jgi:sugar lactone lactonase YvrE
MTSAAATITHEETGTIEGLYQPPFCRIVKYWLKGPKAGSHEIFFDNLPGYPDNIRSDGRGGFWVALHTGRSKVMVGHGFRVLHLVF